MKNILLFFCVLWSFKLSAQAYPIELKTEHFTIVGRQFHIDTVVDGRIGNSDSLGIVRIGLFDKKQTAFISGGVALGVQNYLMGGLSKGKYTEGISIKIKHLSISEYVEQGVEFGKARITLEFYKRKDSLIGKVFECSFELEEFSVNDNTSATHEKRIREILVNCMNDFNTSNWQEKDSLNFISAKEFYNVRVNSSYARLATQKDFLVIKGNILIGYRFYNQGKRLRFSAVVELIKQNDSTAYADIKKAQQLHIAAQVIGDIGGACLGYQIGMSLHQDKIYPALLIISGTSLLIAYPMEYRSLVYSKKTVEQFNSVLQ